MSSVITGSRRLSCATRTLVFLLASLMLHGLLLWPSGFAGFIDARNTAASSRPAVLTAQILAAPTLRQSAEPEPDTAVVSPSRTPTEDAAPAARELTSAESTTPYFEAERLTKAPAPVSEIDLNEGDLADHAITGTMEFAVYINAYGLVVDVVPSGVPDGAGPLAERIVARFRSARFYPGELNGKAVDTRIRIRVVSEALLPSQPQ